MSMPLMSDQLALPEKVVLGSLTTHPGFHVLVKLLDAECRRATEDVIKLDPIDKGYQQKLMALQTRARNMNEFCADVLKSIRWNIADGQVQQADADESKRSAPIKQGTLILPPKKG